MHYTLYKKTVNGSVIKKTLTLKKENEKRYRIISSTGHLKGKQRIKELACIEEGRGRTTEKKVKTAAEKKIKSLYVKSLKSGYSINLEKVRQSKYNTYPDGSIMPMLLNSADSPKDVKNSRVIEDMFIEHDYLYIQPKMYGERCIKEYHKGKVRLKSRGGEIYKIPHLQKQVEYLHKMFDYPLDGELIAINMELGDIRKLIKNSNSDNNKAKKLVYVVYDIPVENVEFDVRLNLRTSLDLTHTPNIILCPTVKVMDIETLHKLHVQYTCLYGEGSVVRVPTGLYEFGFRSNSVVKVKPRRDDEFLCVGYEISDKNNTTVTLTLKTETGSEFRAVVKGVNNTTNVSDWTGKNVTVEYLKKSKNGIPLEPVAVGPRPDRDIQVE